MLTKEQALDLVADALVSLGETTQDLDLVRAGKFVYTDVEDAFRTCLTPSEPRTRLRTADHGVLHPSLDLGSDHGRTVYPHHEMKRGPNTRNPSSALLAQSEG